MLPPLSDLSDLVAYEPDGAGIAILSGTCILGAPLAGRSRTMTATILSFPTAFERDQIGFDRHGASNYTRAIAEAGLALADALAGLGGKWREARRRALGGAIAHLASYRDDLPMVDLPGGGMVDLALVPDLLSALSGSDDCEEPTQGGEVLYWCPRS